MQIDGDTKLRLSIWFGDILTATIGNDSLVVEMLLDPRNITKRTKLRWNVTDVKLDGTQAV